MLDELIRRVVACTILLLVTLGANAQLEIEITEYAGKQTPVAVVPFGWEGQEPTAPFDIAAVIAADLHRSGRFAPIPENDMLQKPVTGIEVDFDDWSILAVEARRFRNISSSKIIRASLVASAKSVGRSRRLI